MTPAGPAVSDDQRGATLEKDGIVRLPPPINGRDQILAAQDSISASVSKPNMFCLPNLKSLERVVCMGLFRLHFILTNA